MAATITDLSRRGDQGFALPALFGEAHALLMAWITAANGQNPSQLLSLLTGPAGAPGFCGWTLKARLAALSSGQPVELISQWVANLSTGAVTTHAGLASGFTAGTALGGHGSLTGGVGTASSLITLPPQPLPLGAVVASSLAAGQEFLCFAFSQHSFSNRQAVALLIAKDVVSAQWHLSLTDMAGVIAAVAWNLARPQVMLSTAFRADFFSSAAPLMLVRPAQWVPITPSVVYTTPLPPVQWWDPVALPADLALYNRTFTSLGYIKPADGSEWLQLGPSRLVVRLKDPVS
ncbi:hypothetical protein KBY66_03700 [Synechococcus sp. Tobar12-5m-g]|uniref:hypothetical protein n=1 Tax=unclassified Synechococcus TaxID=2626047 RepID=UPI0020CEB0DE|nr:MULTISPECIES: hypothetical protein [unclassified Synechococcus]MCP9771731.1 hypothetical protein [Synechococcus sp. Tobar12-5m-g]MCP9872673.1 hypothetical protein [Synechococcus sp. Cruz CV-v-12]